MVLVAVVGAGYGPSLTAHMAKAGRPKDRPYQRRLHAGDVGGIEVS